MGVGPVFDVDAPNCAITGLLIRNAPEQAILARAQGLRIADLKIFGSDVAVHVAESVNNLIAENSLFENNRIGVWIATDTSGTILRNNRFSSNKDAGIWAVGGKQPSISSRTALELRSNHFEGDRLSIVAGNIAALIEDNEFVKARETALYLTGQGAIVRGNRIRNGAAIGIFAHTTQGTVIENNEVDHNQTLAMLVRSAESTLVQNNRVYNNGYGIGFVLGRPGHPSTASDNTLLSQQFDGIILIGDSPILRGNQLINNKDAGLRILDFLPSNGPKVSAVPFLADNRLEGNKLNEPIRGDYRVQTREKAQ
jgi:parallel beta-helix repeat protein